ncbi:hypothetical protein FAI40_04020 [Acetobacteraceae bacterium]|nr:hypothetical protein FAI40_04020 [Acetobacteraceae bacterium]
MKKNVALFALLSAFTSLFAVVFGVSKASAQIFSPPVPAAQAQSEDDGANTAFNNAVSAHGGAPEAPPSAGDSDAGTPAFNPAEPGVTTSFGQGSSEPPLPPPNSEAQLDAVENGAMPGPAPQQPPQETQQERDTAQAAQNSGMPPQAAGTAHYTGKINANNLGNLNPAANAGN